MATCPSCGHQFDHQSLDTIWVDEELLAVCNQAHAMAEQHRAPEVRIAHVLYVIVHQAHAHNAFQHFGISQAQLARNLTNYLHGQHHPLGNPRNLTTAAELRALLARTKQHAADLNRRLITVKDLLVTLITSGQVFEASHLLHQSRISPLMGADVQRMNPSHHRGMIDTTTHRHWTMNSEPNATTTQMQVAASRHTYQRNVRVTANHTQTWRTEAERYSSAAPDAWATNGSGNSRHHASAPGHRGHDISRPFHQPQGSETSSNSHTNAPLRSQTHHDVSHSEGRRQAYSQPAAASRQVRQETASQQQTLPQGHLRDRQREQPMRLQNPIRSDDRAPHLTRHYDHMGHTGNSDAQNRNAQNRASSNGTDASGIRTSRATTDRNPSRETSHAYSISEYSNGNRSTDTTSKGAEPSTRSHRSRQRTSRSQWQKRMRVRRRTSSKRVRWANRKRLSRRGTARSSTRAGSQNSNWTRRDQRDRARFDHNRKSHQHRDREPDERSTSQRPRQDRQSTSAPDQQDPDANDDAPRFYLAIDDDIVDAPSIGPKTATRLNRVGLHTVRDRFNCDPEAIAQALNSRHISAAKIIAWQKQARLVCTIPGLRGTHAQLFVGAGLETPDDITAIEAGSVCATILRFAATKEGQNILRSGSPPPKERILSWVENAGRTEPQRVA